MLVKMLSTSQLLFENQVSFCKNTCNIKFVKVLPFLIGHLIFARSFKDEKILAEWFSSNATRPRKKGVVFKEGKFGLGRNWGGKSWFLLWFSEEQMVINLTFNGYAVCNHKAVIIRAWLLQSFTSACSQWRRLK